MAIPTTTTPTKPLVKPTNEELAKEEVERLKAEVAELKKPAKFPKWMYGN